MCPNDILRLIKTQENIEYKLSLSTFKKQVSSPLKHLLNPGFACLWVMGS